MILLGQEHCAVVEQIRIRVVSVDQEDFGNVSASGPALDMYDHIQGRGRGLTRETTKFRRNIPRRMDWRFLDMLQIKLAA